MVRKTRIYKLLKKTNQKPICDICFLHQFLACMILASATSQEHCTLSDTCMKMMTVAGFIVTLLPASAT
jgi:hypothetical protein